MERISLILPAKLKYYDTSRQIINSICSIIEKEQGISGLKDQVITAFNEAFTNIVIHSYKENEGDVEITIYYNNQKLQIIMVDQGIGFEPEKITPPNLESLPEGGLGWFIINSFMSRVSYKRESNRNILIMEKEFKEVK